MSQSGANGFEQRAAAEIDALHRLLQAWLRGEGGDDPAPILARFDPEYFMVGAAGNVVTREMMQAGLPQQRGSRPTLVMEISDVVVRHIDGATAVVSYKERQIQDSGETERWSTAVLIDRPDREAPVWRCLHETFCA